MSRIDELIAELCPDGVEFKTLGEVANFRYGFTAKAADAGRFRFIRITDITDSGRLSPEGAKYVDSTEGASEYLVRRGDLLVARTGATFGKTLLVEDDQPAIYASFLIRIGLNENQLLPSYYWQFAQSSLYWQQANSLVSTGGQPQFNANVIKDIRLPIPPLEVQREIVKVLGAFTDLEVELEAELAARRRQYQYYRDTLLTFDEPTTGASKGWTTLSEIGKFTRGRRFTNSDFVESGVGCIHYGEIYTHYGLFASKTKSFVSPELAVTLRMAKPGNLVVAGTGENVEDIGKAVAWLGDDEVAVHDDCYIFSHSLNPKYMSYFFQSSHFNEQKGKYAAGAKMIRVSSDGLGKIRIYVPPVKEQERIVSILDTFDAFLNDPSSGLPAESKARRQQCEYYRNRLLTFRESL